MGGKRVKMKNVCRKEILRNGVYEGKTLYMVEASEGTKEASS
jgi:hypothetical protein